MSTVKHTIELNCYLPPLPPTPHKKSPDLHDSEKSPLKVQGGSGPPDPPRPATGLPETRTRSGWPPETRTRSGWPRLQHEFGKDSQCWCIQLHSSTEHAGKVPTFFLNFYYILASEYLLVYRTVCFITIITNISILTLMSHLGHMCQLFHYL